MRLTDLHGKLIKPAFLTKWRGEVRERDGRTRRAPLGARRCAFDNTSSTASKRNEVMAVLSRLAAVSDYVKQEVGTRVDRRGSWH